MTLLATEEYVESSYFAATDYVGGIAQGEADTTTTYVEEGYIETGYFRAGGGAFTLTADLTIAIQEADATLSSAFSISATIGTLASGDAQLDSAFSTSASVGRIRSSAVSISGAFTPTMTVNITADGDIALSSQFAMSVQGDRFRTTDSLLSFQAALDAQAAVTVSGAAQLDAVFTAEHTVDGGFDLGFDVDANFEGASTLTSAFSISGTLNRVHFGEADLSSSTTLVANAIQYVRRANPFNRPINFSPTDQVSTTDGIQGGRAYVNPTTGSELTSDELGTSLGNEWSFIWHSKFYADKANEGSGSIKLFSYGLTNPAIEVYKDNVSYGGSLYPVGLCKIYGANGNLLFNLRAEAQSTPTSFTDLIRDGHEYYTFYIQKKYISATGQHLYYFKWARDDHESYTAAYGSTSSNAALYDPGSGDRKFRFYRYTKGTNTSTHQIDELGFYNRYDADDLDDYGYDDNTAYWGEPPFIAEAITRHQFDGDTTDDTGIDQSLDATTISSAASITADGIKLVEADADLSSAFSISATATRLKTASASLAVSSTVSASVDRVRSIDATLDSTATVSADVGAIRQGETDFDSIASILTAASMIGDFFVNMDVVAGITAAATRTATTSATIDAEFGITTTGQTTKTTEADLSTTTDITITGEKILSGAAALAGVVDISATGDRFRGTDAQLDAVTIQSCLASKSSPHAVDMNSEFALSCDIERIAGAEATLEATVTVNFGGGFVANASATLPGFFAILSVNKILHIDEFVYVIPAENREYKIKSETREYTIPQETREYKLKGAA